MESRQVVLKCTRYCYQCPETARCRFMELPCELIQMIFRQSSLHQFERVLLGRVCRRLHELQRNMYPFPTKWILSKTVFFQSIASFLLELEQELPPVVLCPNVQTSYCFKNAMSTWLGPFRKLAAHRSWFLRMIESELRECFVILRSARLRAPTIMFAISYILHGLRLTNKQWVVTITTLIIPFGNIWNCSGLFALIRSRWPNLPGLHRRRIIEQAISYWRSDLALLLEQLK